MVAALFVGLLIQDAPALGPVAPAGTNRSLQELGLNLQELLRDGKIEEARAVAKALPRYDFTLHLDLSGAPEERRATFREAVERALEAYRKILPEFKPTISTTGPGQLKLGFGTDLGTENGLPLGAALQSSNNPADPRVDVTLALRRGKPAVPILPSEIQNETFYAITQYFGQQASLRPGVLNFRTDLPGLLPALPMDRDAVVIRNLMEYAGKLAQIVKEGKPVTPARPALFLEKSGEMEVPGMKQGEVRIFDIQVANNGNAPLYVRAESECGCYIPRNPGPIEPGQVGLVRVAVNSFDFVGKLSKVIRFLSNDPDFPSRELRVRTEVTPLFRLVPGQTVVEADEDGGEGFFYFLTEDPRLAPTEVRVSGFETETTFEPWSGLMADPESTDPPVMRKGFRIRTKLGPVRNLRGRTPATLTIMTDAAEDRFRMIRTNFQVQKGISVLPANFYFGEIAAKPTLGYVVLSRPTRPFKITKVVSNHPNLKAEFHQVGPGEYRLDIAFDGKADLGDLIGEIVVSTDDPKQPTISVPVQGLVR